MKVAEGGLKTKGTELQEYTAKHNVKIVAQWSPPSQLNAVTISSSLSCIIESNKRYKQVAFEQMQSIVW